MSTNYYLKAAPRCEHCGRGPDRGPHIGKASSGWAFSLRVYPSDESWRLDDHGISVPVETINDWIPLFHERGVVDEYGDDVTSSEMIRIITECHHPNGLRRHI